ncbi:MAG: FtsX-like permease family protein [Lachnospiraceae bacterium]
MKNKKIVFHVTRQYMKKNRKRTMTTLIGIMFMVVMMTCVFVGKDTALAYLVQVAELKSGSWHMQVYDANSDQYEMIKNLDYMQQTAVSYDLGFAECKESKNERKPYWEVKAYSKPCFDWMNIRLKEGHLPQKENEIVISETAIKDGADLKIGDTVKLSTFTRSIKGVNPGIKENNFPFYGFSVKYGETVQVPQEFPFFQENKDFEELHTATGTTHTYTIVGMIQAPSYEKEDGSFYAALTYTPNQMCGREKINVNCRFDQTFPFYRNEYLLDIPWIMGERENAYEVNDLVLTFSGQSSEGYMNRIVKFLVIFFLIFILAVSMILIYNVFNISYEERCRYLGMLSSVGATKRQRCSSVYYEAMRLLLFALPAGILLGLGVVKAGMLVLRPYIFQLENMFVLEEIGQASVHLVITPVNLFLVAFVSAIVVWISAIIPARKIGKIGTIESIQRVDQTKKKRYQSKKHLWEKGKIEALLAYNDLHRQKGKAKNMIRALTVFLLVLTVTSFGANAVTRMVQYRIGVENESILCHMSDYDYHISEGWGNDLQQRQKESDVYEKMRKEIQEDPSVAETKEWYEGWFAAEFAGSLLNESYWDAYQAIAEEYYWENMTEEEFKQEVFAGGGSYESLNILAVDTDTFSEIAKNCGCSQKILTQAEYPGILYQNVQLSTDFLRFGENKPKHYRMFDVKKICDRKKGDSFPISMYGSNGEDQEHVSFTLAGYANPEDVQDYVSFFGSDIWMITSTDVAKKLNRITGGRDGLNSEEAGELNRELYVRFSDKNSSLAQKLNELGEDDTLDLHLSIRKPASEMVETFTGAIHSIIQVLSVCFVLFTGFICMLNLYNSIRERALMRKREMAMLRSVGMEEGQMLKMLSLEMIGIWMRGVFWSVVISLPIIYGIDRFLKRYFGEFPLTFPWLIYVAALVLTLLSLLFLTWVCYHGKENENLLEQMRMENV